MNKIYIWIGATLKNEDDYWNYFYTPIFDDMSQFCLDVGLSWLDEDFMGYYYNKHSDSLQEAIENTPESGLYGSITEVCISMGITKANAMFYYTGNDIITVDPTRKYNDLNYIGVFDWK